MGNFLKRDLMFLFNLVLFLQLYFYHTLKVEAIQRESFTNCSESDHQNGSTINGKDEGSPQRPKRPARLMPVQLLINDDEDETPETTNKIITDTRFYGPANSCVEIAKLGYTLNGYYLVKGNTTTNSQIQVLGCKFKHSDGSKEAKEEKVGIIDIEIKSKNSFKRRSIQSMTETELEAIDDYLYKQKRPARLLPLRMTLGKEKNKTVNRNAAESRFYGPATSCDELGKLGYTLNGLYLVDCKDKSNKGRIEVIICRFKQSNGSKEVKEERLGFVKIDVKKSKAVNKRRALRLLTNKEKRFTAGSENFHRLGKRPIRLLPPHLLYGKVKNDTEVTNPVKQFYSLPSNCSDLGRLGYTLNGFYLVNGTNNRNIEIVLCRFQHPIREIGGVKEERFDLATTTTTKKPNQFRKLIYTAKTKIGFKQYKRIPLYDTIGISFFLMNNHGKCLIPKTYNYQLSDRAGLKLIQTVCNTFYPSFEDGIGWSMKKGDNYRGGMRLNFVSDCISFDGFLNGTSKYATILDVDEGECYNQTWKELENGYQFASGNSCLAIEGDSAESYSYAVSAVCDAKQKGQIWSFVEFY